MEAQYEATAPSSGGATPTPSAVLVILSCMVVCTPIALTQWRFGLPVWAIKSLLGIFLILSTIAFLKEAIAHSTGLRSATHFKKIGTIVPFIGVITIPALMTVLAWLGSVLSADNRYFIYAMSLLLFILLLTIWINNIDIEEIENRASPLVQKILVFIAVFSLFIVLGSTRFFRFLADIVPSEVSDWTYYCRLAVLLVSLVIIILESAPTFRSIFQFGRTSVKRTSNEILERLNEFFSDADNILIQITSAVILPFFVFLTYVATFVVYIGVLLSCLILSLLVALCNIVLSRGMTISVIANICTVIEILIAERGYQLYNIVVIALLGGIQDFYFISTILLFFLLIALIISAINVADGNLFKGSLDGLLLVSAIFVVVLWFVVVVMHAISWVHLGFINFSRPGWFSYGIGILTTSLLIYSGWSFVHRQKSRIPELES